MPTDFGSLRAAFESAYGRAPSIFSEAPGRVNLIGEHTDYNGGFVLPAAIDRTVALAAAPRGDGIIRAKSLDYDQCDEFAAERPRRFMGSRGWRDYVRGVAWALGEEQFPVSGADLLVVGDVPQGAGLSSSAALEVAAAGGMAHLAGHEIPPGQLALLAQRAENLFVGVQCGAMDQLTSALGVRGHALLIDCRGLSIESVTVPDELSLVIIDSGIRRSLSDTAYNQRREECSEAAQALGVTSLREIEGEFRPPASLPGVLVRRARHVVTENGRVRSMSASLKAGELGRIGQLMRESHASLRDDFEVSTPELDALVEIAGQTEGVVGARLTGAGFGGCTVNVVKADAETMVAETIVAKYNERTGRTATAYVCRAVDGLRVTDA